MKARNILTGTLSAVALVLGIGFAAPAQARDYPWCVNHRGSQDCSYVTREQCQASASEYGICEANPRTAFHRD